MENKDGGKAGQRARQLEKEELQRIVQNGIEISVYITVTTRTYSSGPSTDTLQGKRARLANLTLPLYLPSFCGRGAGYRGLDFTQLTL